MPVLTISMCKGRTPYQKARLKNAVCTALQETFCKADNSYSIRMMEFTPEDFFLPPPKTQGYLLFEVDCFPGREESQKNQFYQSILAGLQEIGEDPEQALILIREPPLENWGYAGKKNILPSGLRWYYHTTL